MLQGAFIVTHVQRAVTEIRAVGVMVVIGQFGVYNPVRQVARAFFHCHGAEHRR